MTPWRSVLDVVSGVSMIIASGIVVYVMLAVAAPPTSGAASRAPVALPTAPVAVGNAPALGDPGARVVMIEYSDLQCPVCRRFTLDVLPTLLVKYIDTGRVRLVFRHLPIDSLHPVARRAAEAAQCAHRGEAFWAMQDLLFRRQARLDESQLLPWGIEVGLDESAYSKCLGGEAADDVEQDMLSAQLMGITATPTFLLGVLRPDSLVDVRQVIVGLPSVVRFESILDDFLAQESAQAP